MTDKATTVIRNKELVDVLEMLRLYLQLSAEAKIQAKGVVIGLGMHVQPPEPKKTA